MPRSFSDGVDNFIELVRPYGSRPDTSFPNGLSETDSRRNDRESLHAWFVRLVDQYCDSRPDLYCIEENIALFAKFRWRGGKLIYASVPVLVADCPLDKFYQKGRLSSATYLRLDLNYDTLGEPFSHPLAHVHIGTEDLPRFNLDGGTSGNVVMDFLEFVYRNYVPDKWLQWARRVWLSQFDDEQREIQFELITQAFRDAQFNVLRQNAEIISQIKRQLRESKDSFFGSHVNENDREILEYPLAR